jgi:hypothetical protein
MDRTEKKTPLKLTSASQGALHSLSAIHFPLYNNCPFGQKQPSTLSMGHENCGAGLPLTAGFKAACFFTISHVFAQPQGS